MPEWNVTVDHVSIWRWVRRYSQELNRRCRPELYRTNGSWRVTRPTCGLPVSGPICFGRWILLGPPLIFSYRPDETLLLRSAFPRGRCGYSAHTRPRVINVDGNP